ncbi:TolC family protein [Fulvivirgaceae bacterium PWU4]|uniref:TolC family protein n=1 Tax=Chryseosolibacter histidini TaxID=2782349 RepID=A0AAP2DFQ1_9BACT|nr:TolC family protein [Chryseosolibacter histidini]MBT1695291.1 TolC family protein [Chryseosolibacter histidini]
MKRIVFLFFHVLIVPYAFAQERLTIGECYERAESNYPLIRQRELIAKSKAYSIENASKGALPQIMIGGQATYQSDVTQVPLSMPGMEIETLSKDQYKLFGEISQTLYNGGVVRQQKQLEEVNGRVEEQKLEVELYQLKNRINELFFGTLLIREQIIQSELVKQDIASGLKKIEASIANGTALKSAGDVLRAELLKTDQRIIELQAAGEAYREMLGLFINQQVSEDAILEKPQSETPSQEINRPELTLYTLQQQNIDVSRALLSARKRPKIELFVQGGYGRPALNMLRNDFDTYYIGGVRFSWMLSGFYTFEKEKQILDLRRQSLDAQKETFLFNTRLTLGQQDTEVTKLQRLIAVDRDIITLRTQVKQTASVQLEQGTITSTDYVREVNAEDQARQNLVLHETQLLVASAKHQFTSGN